MPSDAPKKLRVIKNHSREEIENDDAIDSRLVTADKVRDMIREVLGVLLEFRDDVKHHTITVGDKDQIDSIAESIADKLDSQSLNFLHDNLLPMTKDKKNFKAVIKSLGILINMQNK